MDVFEVPDTDRTIVLEPLCGIDVRWCIWQAQEVVRVIGGKVQFTVNGSTVTVDRDTPYAELYKSWREQMNKAERESKEK